jgi:hypothetical protein
MRGFLPEVAVDLVEASVCDVVYRLAMRDTATSGRQSPLVQLPEEAIRGRGEDRQWKGTRSHSR